MSRYAPKPESLLQRFYTQKHENNLKPWDDLPYQQKIDCVEITDEYFLNDHGCYRWKNIRNAYFNDFIDTDRVEDLFVKWRDQKEYLWLDGYTDVDKYVISCFVKAAKRGNDVYKDRVNKKFRYLDELEPIFFFEEDWGVKQSPMIFVTLTADPKKYSLNEAWKNISDELHLFESKLRQKYGKYKCMKCGKEFITRRQCPRCEAPLKYVFCIGSFVKFRVWEAHKSGYPHCHVIYYFHNYWFHLFEHKDKFRISTKQRDTIKGFWAMGNVDIQGVRDTHGAFKEVKKYVTKTIWSKKSNLTNSMLCLFRKQSYWISGVDYKQKEKQLFREGKSVTEVSDYILKHLDKWISRDFIGSIWGYKAYMDLYNSFKGGAAAPSAAALVTDTVRNCNIEFPEIDSWRFRGCVLYSDLQIFLPDVVDSWVIKAKPPPEFEAYLGILDPVLSFEEVDDY